MKNLYFIAILFLSVNFYAQSPRGNKGNKQQNQKPKEFKASEAAGLFYYDIDKIIKKLKVKDDEAKQKITKAIRNYNFQIKKIALLNSTKFNDLNLIMNSRQKGQENKDDNFREKIQEVIRPIRQEVHLEEEKLNEELETLLDVKRNKKWLKYQKKKKQSLAPKKLNNQRKPSNRQQGMRGGGMRRQ